jgi:hypothetical protein
MKKCSASHGQNNQHSGQTEERKKGGKKKARKEKYVCEGGKTKEGSQEVSFSF